MASVEFSVSDYDFAATLAGGQAFRWRAVGEGWEGVVHGRWVRLLPRLGTLSVESPGAISDWSWLVDYLALDEDLGGILRTFPDDAPLGAAVKASPGLRLLRQEPWECLASFILSSSKQIVQIQECVRLLCERYGEAIPAGVGCSEGAGAAGLAWSFPSPERVAGLEEPALRACKLGFRAPYLLGTARMIAAGVVNLPELRSLPTEAAREELLKFPGVGQKIADCVLLFAYRRQDAFPVDVWVQQALTHLYFPRARRVTAERLRRFSATYFGPNSGYAQQYLFHYVRTVLGRRWSASVRSTKVARRRSTRAVSNQTAAGAG